VVQWVAKTRKKIAAILLSGATKILRKASDIVWQYSERGTPPPYPGVRYREWKKGVEQ